MMKLKHNQFINTKYSIVVFSVFKKNHIQIIQKKLLIQFLRKCKIKSVKAI
jgi:hypothetical protein